jgi:hypothetical protein
MGALLSAGVSVVKSIMMMPSPPDLEDKRHFPALSMSPQPCLTLTHESILDPPSSQPSAAHIEPRKSFDEMKHEVNVLMGSTMITLKNLIESSTAEVAELRADNEELKSKLLQAEQVTAHAYKVSQSLQQEKRAWFHSNQNAIREANELRSEVSSLHHHVHCLEQELDRRMTEIERYEKRSVRAQDREIELEFQLREMKAMLPSEGQVRAGPPPLSVRALSSVCSIGCFESGLGSVEMRQKLGALEQCLMKATASQGHPSQAKIVSALSQALFQPGLLGLGEAETIIPQNEVWGTAMNLSVLVLRSARCRSLLREENMADDERVRTEVEALIDLLCTKLEITDPRGLQRLPKLVFLAAELWTFCTAAHPLLFILVSEPGCRVDEKKHTVVSIQGHEGKMREGEEMMVVGTFSPGIAYIPSSNAGVNVMVAKEKVIARYINEKEQPPEEPAGALQTVTEEVQPAEDQVKTDKQSNEAESVVLPSDDDSREELIVEGPEGMPDDWEELNKEDSVDEDIVAC